MEHITKKLSRSQARWDTNMAVVSLRSDFNRHVCAPYLGVRFTRNNGAMNRLRKGFSKVSKQSLLKLWVLSLLCFCIWSVSWAVMTYFALKDDGISPNLKEYILSYLDHRYITTTTLVFVFSGIIPSLILVFTDKVKFIKLSKMLWATQIIGVSVFAILSKAMFFYA